MNAKLAVPKINVHVGTDLLVTCRMFWPKEIWGQYANDLEEFKLAENSHKAVQALNTMVADALR